MTMNYRGNKRSATPLKRQAVYMHGSSRSTNASSFGQSKRQESEHAERHVLSISFHGRTISYTIGASAISHLNIRGKMEHFKRSPHHLDDIGMIRSC